MFFCESCGAIITTVENSIGVCACGHKQPVDSKTPERAVKAANLGILDSALDPIAAFDHICPKCGFDKARLYSKGTMVTDEDEHMAYVCGRCGHHDRCDGLKIT